MELREATRRNREENEAETAHDSVEAAVGETERLAVVDHDRSVRRACESLARPKDHGLGAVGSRDVAGRADHGDSALRRDSSTGRDVEHALAGLKTCRPQEERQEVRRDMSDGLVICGCSLVFEK